MKIKTITPNLMTEDVDKTVEWYKQYFGAHVVSSVPYHRDSNKLQWVRVKLGESELMFQLRENILDEVSSLDLEKPNYDMLSFFIVVVGLEKLYKTLKREKVTVVCDWHTTFYGMNEVMIRDCNGYLLNLAEPVKK